MPRSSSNPFFASRPSRRVLIAGTVWAVALAGGLVFRVVTAAAPIGSSTAHEPSPAPIAEADRITTAAVRSHASDPDPNLDGRAPKALSEWAGWNDAQRLDFITEVQQDSSLPDALVSFLQEVIRDRSLDALTRNNAANALVIQERRDPELAGFFCAMMEDPAEDEQWRDYALQFLATSLDWSANPSAMTAAMWRVASDSKGSIVGTALLHLHYLDECGRAPLPSGYHEYLSRCLRDGASDTATCMTVIGIIAQRGMDDQRPVLRMLVQDTVQPAIRRAALAALGRIGEQSDQDLIGRFVDDRDPLTASSARGAAEALASRAFIDAPDSPFIKP